MIILSVLMLMPALASCTDTKKNEPDEPVDKDSPAQMVDEVERAIVVYAVNNSSLSSDFKDDSREMLDIMKFADATRYRLLVYYTYSNEFCGLFEARNNDRTETCEFVRVKQYDRTKLSTDPERIAQVLEDALTVYPNAEYELVFWGHGTSWRPEFSDHQKAEPVVQGYGGEYNPGSMKTDWTTIDELADAIPDNRFDTIWFDCCYMSGIENIYQFRDKCRNFVAYPTEVWQYGLAYDVMLPFMFRDTPDLKGAAEAFYLFYELMESPVTVAVIDMSKLETVADIAREIVEQCPYTISNVGLLNYSRMMKLPLYDFRQLFATRAEVNGRPDLADKMYDAMSQMVVYHAESEKNFSFMPWNTNNISGVSTHLYLNADTAEDDYYRTLDWYRRVYD